MKKRVGFVVTGSEIVNGDILNSNGQYFAHSFIEHNIEPGCQIIVGDDQAEIEAAIHFLLKQHHAIITIGGLGPTSDDLTRFALASALNLSLVFHELAWQWIVERLSKFNLTIPDNNKQQALFPQDSEVIHNPNGTAAACYFHHQGCDFFMLPGPPNECYPIFGQAVLPKLLDLHYGEKTYRTSWLLLGVSESAIAKQLDPLIPQQSCLLGYRVQYPYLEIKLSAKNADALQSIVSQIDGLIRDKSVSREKKTASQQLIEFIATQHRHYYFLDQATHGALQSRLYSPHTYPHLSFSEFLPRSESIIQITVEGLNEYWKNSDELSTTPLHVRMNYGRRVANCQKDIPLRGSKTMELAVEVICWQVLRQLHQWLGE